MALDVFVSYSHRDKVGLATTLAAAIAIVFGGCGEAALTAEPEPAHTSAWQDIADEFREFQQDLIVPDHLRAGEGFDGTEFDPQEFFEILNRIGVEPGFVLDYVYRAAPGYGGEPILYVRRSDTPRFLTVEEWSGSPQSDVHFTDQIHVIDGTPEGFFQYVLLHKVGDQFYLFWHAQDEDVSIIAVRERWDRLIDSYSGSMDGAEVATARFTNPSPRVTMSADTVTVEIYTFTPWGGFFHTVYTIERTFPQRILDVQTESVGRCDCGLTF